MKRLAIVSAQIAVRWGGGEDSFGYETRDLLRAARQRLGDAFCIHPRRIGLHYSNRRGKYRARVIHQGEDVSDLTYLIVRGVTGVNTQISTLALTLAAIGCRVIDSPEVFAGEEASKALSSSRRFMRGGLPETFIAFSLDQARVLLEIAQAEDLFPLIAKPHLGKQGQGIARLHGPRDAERYVATFFEADVKPLVKVLLVQQMIDLEAEFRVLVVGNRPLGVVRKIPCHSDGTGNASTGARFEQVEDESVVEFARRQAEQDGLAIAGVDIGRGRDGSIYLLENNRAPQWQNFESATSINVADEVLDYLCSDSP